MWKGQACFAHAEFSGVVGAALAERRLCQLDADPFCEHALSRVAHVGADASLKRVWSLFWCVCSVPFEGIEQAQRQRMLPGSSFSYFCLRRFASPVWILLVPVFIIAIAACNFCRAPGEIFVAGGGGVGVGVGVRVGAEAAATAFGIRSKWSCSHHHRDRRV